LQQALKITERLEESAVTLSDNFEKEKVEFYFKENSSEDKFAFFPITDAYKSALETSNLTYAGMNHKDKQKEIIGHIETIVKNYPIVWWAQFSRVLLSAVCMIFITGPIISLIYGAGQNSSLDLKYMGIGAGISLIPFIFFWWQNRQRKQALKSMVIQYIAVALDELNQKALDYNRNKISECMKMICSYLNWVKIDKIQKRLIGGIQLNEPKEFLFSPSESFQPLFTIPSNVKNLNNNAITNTNVLPEIKSASFGIPKVQLFDDLSKITTKVNCLSGPIQLIDLVNNDDKKIELLNELMSQKVEVNRLFSDATITQDPPFITLLLLDVSGSMRGDNFNKLTKVVANLKNTHQDNLKWIAFSDEAKTDDECNNKIPELFGYTNLNAAFEMLSKIKINSFDKVIIVSDGLPTSGEGVFIDDEGRQLLCQKAFSFNKPLDVIYIGSDDEGKKFMKTLAETTGGKSYEQSIHTLDDRLSNSLKIKYDISGENATKTFDELLQMGHTDACNEGLKLFCSNKLYNVTSTIEDYLTLQGSSDIGMRTFLSSATILPNALNASDQTPYLFYKYNNNFDIEDWLNNHKQNSGLISTLDFITEKYYEIPNIMNTVLGLRPLGGLINLNTEDKLKEKIKFSKNDAWDLIKNPVNIKNEPIEFTNKQD
jgi:hypothetical protein